MKTFKSLALLTTMSCVVPFSSAFAGTYELRGTLPLQSNSCTNAPRTMTINEELQCVTGYCAVDDRFNGVVMQGVDPAGTALLEGTFDLGNGCSEIVAYTYSQINTRTKTTHLKEVFIALCPWGNCSSRYEGTVKMR